MRAARPARWEDELTAPTSLCGQSPAQNAEGVPGDSGLETDVLVTLLMQTRAELVRQATRVRQLRQTSRIGWSTETAEDHVGAIKLLRAQEALPHRHLEFLVRHWKVAGRMLPDLGVRLVEHHGQPGLLILSSQGPAEAISAWTPNGEEQGRAFMLLLPTEAQARQRLMHLGASDWRLVNTLARAIQVDLHASAIAAPAHWRVIALRLCRQLDDLSQRLRYDHLEAVRVPDATAPTWEVHLHNAAYADKVLGLVRLHWLPQPPRDTWPLQWLAPTRGQAVPLSDWPVDAGGQLVAAYALPVGAATGAAQRRQGWSALSTSGRALVLAVLETLPAAAAAVPAGDIPSGTSRVALVDAALRLGKGARRTLWMLRLRSMLTGLARRIRQSPP